MKFIMASMCCFFYLAQVHAVVDNVLRSSCKLEEDSVEYMGSSLVGLVPVSCTITGVPNVLICLIDGCLPVHAL